MPIDPKNSTYDAGATAPAAIVYGAAALSVLGALITIWVSYDAYRWHHPGLLFIAIGCWAVVPPIWFWFEYFFVYRWYGKPDTLELFKYGQDVAKAIWAGVLVGLIALASSDAVKPPKKEKDENSQPPVSAPAVAPIK